MMNRRAFLGAVALLGSPLGVAAQQATKVHRIGLLGPSDARVGMFYVEAFRQGLRDLGWVEGENFVIEYRWADGSIERLPALAADLVRLKVDIIVTGASPANQPAKDATKTIPIVMTTGANPVESGLVASLARPGGNITGVSTTAGPEIAAKEIELVKEALPKLSQIAVLLVPTNPAAGALLRNAEVAAQTLRLRLQSLSARGPEDFEIAFSSMRRARVGALLILTDPLFFVHRNRLMDLWVQSRLPTMWGGAGARECVQAGALMGYGPSLPDLFRRAAGYVDKILKGAKPAELPVEQPTSSNW